MPEFDLTNFSTEERAQIALLEPERMPQHIAVIMDGNGRWATRQGLPRVFGHSAGVESVRAMFNACDDLGIRYITLYSFSTENWSRPADEIDALMNLIDMQMRSEAEHLHRKNARIRQLGRVEGLPDMLVETLRYIEELTSQNTGITIQFAINYSGRAELLDAAKKLTRAVIAGEVNPETLSEEDLAAALYRPDVPDPDLVIRTAGEMRVSNYLLWQIAYSEFWVTPLFWPEFRAPHLLEALLNYQQRKRKFGGISA